MRKILAIYFLILLLAATVFAQVPSVPIKKGSVVPATCNPNVEQQFLFYNSSSTPGLYQCGSDGKYAAVGRVTPANSLALKFDAAKFNHVNYGIFYTPNVSYGNFYAGLWIKPLGNGYLISVSSGGLHVILFGLNGDSVNGYSLTGNVHNALTVITTSFTTTETIRHGVWSYVALIGDTNKLICSINGIPSSVTVWDGIRRISDIADSNWMLGGSDHNNYTGLIGGIHLFEGALPYATPVNVAIRPPLDNFALAAFRNGSTIIPANLISDFRTGTLTDSSNGFNGSVHNGFLAETLSTGNAGTSYDFDFSHANRNVAANLPQWVVDPITFTGGAAVQTPVVGSRIYDSFGRTDVHYGNAANLSLGVTEVGSKTWTGNGTGNYGIYNGSVFAKTTTNGQVCVTDTNADGTVIWRKSDTGFPLGVSAVFQAVFRQTDSNNYSFIYVDEYGSGYEFYVVAGASTNAHSFSFGTAWTELKVVMAGSSVSTYKDGVLKDTYVMTQNQAATNKCYETNTPLMRLSEFSVQ